MADTPRLKVKYQTEIVPALVEQLGIKNINCVPKLEKIVVNMGVGAAAGDSKLLDAAMNDMRIITGQQPCVTRAKKSIAGFHVREGQAIGCKVTLRGDRMWEFLDRLLATALPRVRDFRGISPKSFDGRGNYTMGVTEQLIFPEIEYDKIDRTRGHGHHLRDQCRRPTIPRSLFCPALASRSRASKPTGAHSGPPRRATSVTRSAIRLRA